VVLVFIFILLSMGFISRFFSIRKLNPFKNKLWIMASITVILLQIIFCLISFYGFKTNSGHSIPVMNTTEFRWYIFLLWPLLIIFLDELCKNHDRTRRDFYHRKARQHFDTVLGMHSPK